MTQPLYEHRDHATQRSTVVTTDSETGLPLIVKRQNLRPVIEANKRAASNFAGTNRAGVTRVASIPMVVWQRLMQTGVAKDPKALAKWLDERDNRVFRTDDGRKL